jgi:hypothetical protein
MYSESRLPYPKGEIRRAIELLLLGAIDEASGTPWKSGMSYWIVFCQMRTMPLFSNKPEECLRR